MPDSIYVLDLQVIGAMLVTVNDFSGRDSIVVDGVYDKTVEISLGWASLSGKATSAGAAYFGHDGLWHRLVVNGLVEDACGSNGQDNIFGNEFANWLCGDQATTGPGGDDTLHGGDGDDTVSGGAGDDRMFGDADNDQLFGNNGADTIIGGAGDDTVTGGAGADVLSGGGSASDTLSYQTSPSGIQMKLTFGTSTTGKGGDAARDIVDGFRHVIGSEFGDTITDTVRQDLGSGNNANAFWGNRGNDKLYLGGGNDTGYGDEGNDLVMGHFGDDMLFGGSNKDRLVGGFGQDSLSGGTGADQFLFKSAGESTADLPDVITDFIAAEGDKIDLRAIDASSLLRGNQTFNLIDNDFGRNAGELRLVTSGDDLVVQGDVNGDAVADFAILLRNITTLTASDFLL
jgi:Ca2+-binding RTX toxin-like protein